MPSGQYFYTNPQAAAIANNISKIVFGDPEERQREMQMQGIQLENQIRQQKIDEANQVNSDRNQLGNLFLMGPAGVREHTPDYYATSARLMGRDGISGNDPNVLLRGFMANSGAPDNSIANAVVGAGNPLNMNEGVSIGDRDTILGKHLGMQKYGIDTEEAGKNQRFTVSPTPGETVYAPNMPNAEGGLGRMFESSPSAVQTYKETHPQKSSSKAPGVVKIDKSVTDGINRQIGAALGFNKKNSPSADDMQIMSDVALRAANYYKTSQSIPDAVDRAIKDVLVKDPNGSWRSGIEAPGFFTYGSSGHLNRNPNAPAGLGDVFAPTPSASLDAAAIAPGPNVVQGAPTGEPIQQPSAVDAGGGRADKPENTVQRNKKTGVVRKVINGQWVILNGSQ